MTRLKLSVGTVTNNDTFETVRRENDTSETTCHDYDLYHVAEDHFARILSTI